MGLFCLSRVQTALWDSMSLFLYFSKKTFDSDDIREGLTSVCQFLLTAAKAFCTIWGMIPSWKRSFKISHSFLWELSWALLLYLAGTWSSKYTLSLPLAGMTNTYPGSSHLPRVGPRCVDMAWHFVSISSFWFWKRHTPLHWKSTLLGSINTWAFALLSPKYVTNSWKAWYSQQKSKLFLTLLLYFFSGPPLLSWKT